jgi:hypothetical protein
VLGGVGAGAGAGWGYVGVTGTVQPASHAVKTIAKTRCRRALEIAPVRDLEIAPTIRDLEIAPTIRDLEIAPTIRDLEIAPTETIL